VQIFVRNDVIAFNEYKRENLKRHAHTTRRTDVVLNFITFTVHSIQYFVLFMLLEQHAIKVNFHK